MDNNSDEHNVDPLALESEVDNDSLVYDVNSHIEPEIILEDCAPLRRSKRCSAQQQSAQQNNNTPNTEQLHLSVAAAAIGPLFPITPKMQQRIKRMKQRMLATLQISDNLSKKRAKQTTETRQREASKESNKKSRKKIHQEIETAEQLMTRRANKGEKSRRCMAKSKREERPPISAGVQREP